MSGRGDRRSDIVRAAFRQVAEVGFEGLRLRQIAEEVGIDHSTLHHHFPGKKDIVAGVAEYAIRQFGTRFPEGSGPLDSLRRYLTHLQQLLENSPEVFVVTAELSLHARRDPEVQAVMDHHEANWRRSLRELVVAGSKQGEWSDRVDVDGMVELVIAAVKGVQLAPESAGRTFAQLIAFFGK